MYDTLVFFCFTETIKERVPDTHEIEADHLLETCNQEETLIEEEVISMFTFYDRDNLSKGLPIDLLTPPSVVDYIKSNNLYL